MIPKKKTFSAIVAPSCQHGSCRIPRTNPAEAQEIGPRSQKPHEVHLLLQRLLSPIFDRLLQLRPLRGPSPKRHPFPRGVEVRTIPLLAPSNHLTLLISPILSSATSPVPFPPTLALSSDLSRRLWPFDLRPALHGIRRRRLRYPD